MEDGRGERAYLWVRAHYIRQLDLGDSRRDRRSAVLADLFEVRFAFIDVHRTRVVRRLHFYDWFGAVLLSRDKIMSARAPMSNNRV